MEKENSAVLKKLLADIRKLGYKTYRKRHRMYIYNDIHFYTITNKITKDQFTLHWHPDSISWVGSPIMFGFFSLQDLVTFTRRTWTEPEIKEVLEDVFQQLTLINKIDPRNEEELKLYHAHKRRLNGVQGWNETTEEWFARITNCL